MMALLSRKERERERDLRSASLSNSNIKIQSTENIGQFHSPREDGGEWKRIES